MYLLKNQIENAVAGASCHKGEVRWDFQNGTLEHSPYLERGTNPQFAPVIYRVQAEKYAYQGYFTGKAYNEAQFLEEVQECITALDNIQTVYPLYNLTEEYFRKNATELLPFLEVKESRDPDYVTMPSYYLDWKKSVFVGGFNQHADAHTRIMSRITGEEVACINKYSITHINGWGHEEKTPNFMLAERQFSGYYKYFTPGMGFHPEPVIFPKV